MTAEAEFGLDVSLSASLAGVAQGIGRLCDRMDRADRLRQRASEAYRQAVVPINVPLTSGAASINPSSFGPDMGFYWSIRRAAAVGFTAGTVTLFVDNTSGEPLVTFTGNAGALSISAIGSGEALIHPASNIAISASGITGTVQLWLAVDSFEQWLLPWYIGAQRDD